MVRPYMTLCAVNGNTFASSTLYYPALLSIVLFTVPDRSYPFVILPVVCVCTQQIYQSKNPTRGKNQGISPMFTRRQVVLNNVINCRFIALSWRQVLWKNKKISALEILVCCAHMVHICKLKKLIWPWCSFALQYARSSFKFKQELCDFHISSK